MYLAYFGGIYTFTIVGSVMRRDIFEYIYIKQDCYEESRWGSLRNLCFGLREQALVFYDSILLSSSRRRGTQISPWMAANQTDGVSKLVTCHVGQASDCPGCWRETGDRSPVQKSLASLVEIYR